MGKDEKGEGKAEGRIEEGEGRGRKGRGRWRRGGGRWRRGRGDEGEAERGRERWRESRGNGNKWEEEHSWVSWRNPGSEEAIPLGNQPTALKLCTSQPEHSHALKQQALEVQVRFLTRT